jgi:hypothetical protein
MIAVARMCDFAAVPEDLDLSGEAGAAFCTAEGLELGSEYSSVTVR